MRNSTANLGDRGEQRPDRGVLDPSRKRGTEREGRTFGGEHPADTSVPDRPGGFGTPIVAP